jgi:hypothetical protein
MSDEKEKSYMSYSFEEFRQQMAEATKLLAKMNEAATYMRWQYETDAEWDEFARQLAVSEGWLSSWCE